MHVDVNQSSLARLQLVQNAAAHLSTNTFRHEHIAPVLHSLHWLPVCFRIDFKLLMLVFKVITSHAPPYLSEILALRKHLQSIAVIRPTNVSSPEVKVQTVGWSCFCCRWQTLEQVTHWYRVPKSRPSTTGPWDLNSEKIWVIVNGEGPIIFLSCLACALNYMYDGWQFKRKFFMQRKLNFVVKH